MILFIKISLKAFHLLGRLLKMKKQKLALPFMVWGFGVSFFTCCYLYFSVLF